jgi:hypothetical protein
MPSGFCSPEIKGRPSDVIQRPEFHWTRFSPGGFRHWADFAPPAQVAAWLRARTPARNWTGPQATVGRMVGRGLLSTVQVFHFYFYFFQKHLNNRFAQLLNSI